MSLEERLRRAIKSGGLLSVALHSHPGKKGTWIATYLYDGSNKRESVEDADPVVALEKTLRPSRQKPAPDNPPPLARRVKPIEGRAREDDLI